MVQTENLIKELNIYKILFLPSRRSSCSKYIGFTIIKRFVLKTSNNSWKNLLETNHLLTKKKLLF